MMNLKKLLVPSLAIAALFCAGTSAQAGTLYPLSINFDSAFQDAYAGTTVTFTATISDLDMVDADVNLDGDSYSMEGPNSLNDAGFYAYSPYFMTPGTTSTDFEIFTITIPTGTALGVYAGDFEIIGNTGGAEGEIADGTFDVDVVPTPEPGSLMLLGTGLIAAAGIARRRFGR